MIWILIRLQFCHVNCVQNLIFYISFRFFFWVRKFTCVWVCVCASVTSQMEQRDRKNQYNHKLFYCRWNITTKCASKWNGSVNRIFVQQHIDSIGSTAQVNHMRESSRLHRLFLIHRRCRLWIIFWWKCCTILFNNF